MRRIWLYSAIAGLLCGSVTAQTNSFWNVRVSTNLILGTSTLTTSNGTLLVNGSPITGGITNATGPGITVASGILTLSTNGWQFGAAQTPWTTNIDAGGFSLLNVGTLAAANIQFGDNSLADMLASRLSTNYNGAWLVGSGGVTNGMTEIRLGSGGTISYTPSFGGTITFSAETLRATRVSADFLSGDGSGLTGVSAATIGGVALAGLVRTQELTNASNTLAQATASKAATGTVITVSANGNSGSVTVGTGGTIALGSDAGKVTTNATFSQLGVRDGSGLTNIPLSGLQTVPLTNNHTAAVTLGGNVTLNGTANIAPNQTASSASSLMTRGLGDERYLLGSGSVGSGAFYYPNTTFGGVNGSGWVYGTNTVFKTELGYRLGFIANGDGCSIIGATTTASTRPILIGVTTEGYSRFGVYADGRLGWGTGTHTMDPLLSLSSRSNLLFTAAVTVSNTVTTTGTLTAGRVAIGATTNRLEVVGSDLLWITGTTTQRVTLGSYP